MIVVLKSNYSKKNWNRHLTPPFALHMGGAWESMVKLAKGAITATTNGAQLTDEELITVAVECEAMLNNRPLTYVGSETDDLEPLTPAHLLTTRQISPLLPSQIQIDMYHPNEGSCFSSKLFRRFGKDGRVNIFCVFNVVQNGINPQEICSQVT